MNLFQKIRFRFTALFEKEKLDAEMDEELRSHIEMRTQQNIDAGMPPDEARRAARRQFGGVESVRETCREQRGVGWIENVGQDIRYGVRMLFKNPGFTAAAVLTLALGIGGSAAVFSIMNAVFLKPLPYDEPDQLVQIWTEVSDQGQRKERSSYANYVDWKSQNSTFEDLAIYDSVSGILTGTDQPERVSVVRTSASLFSLLRVQPVLGRTFTDEEVNQQARVIVLNYGFWQRRYSGASSVIGQTLEIDGQQSEIIGVMPQHFGYPSENENLWEPLTLYPGWDRLAVQRRTGFWSVQGRLKRGQGLDLAREEMNSIAASLAVEYPDDNRGLGVRLVPLQEEVAGPNLRLAVWVLFGAVVSVLLIGCANLVNLLLVRGVTRRKEFAMRLALGASPFRLIRQLMAESLPVSLLGGAAGVLLAGLIVHALRILTGTRIPRLAEADLDPVVLCFALGLSILTGLIFGIIPGMQVRNLELNEPLKEGERAIGGSRQTALRNALVIGEVALASLLLFGAGLLIRSFELVRAVDPGFEQERLLYVPLRFPKSSSNEEAVFFFDELSRSLQAMPGVQAVGLIEDVFGGSNVNVGITVEDRPAESGRINLAQIRGDAISPAWFRTVGVPLRQGRFFDDGDRADALPVAIINERMALNYWSGQDPIGKRFAFGVPQSATSWLTVVGVVGDMRRENLERAAIPQVFLPFAQNPSLNMELLVKTTSAPLDLAESVRHEIRTLNKRVAIYPITTLEHRLGSSLLERRFQTSLLSAFSFVALILAGIGTYGVVHYSARQRTREIAIRMAMGAQRIDVLWLVLSQGMKPGLTGAGIGIGIGLIASRFMQGLLFEIQPADPLTLTAVSFTLTAIAMLACWLPARRATKVDPMTALRYE